MKATLVQKVAVLGVLYGYCKGQITGAESDIEFAVQDNNEECGVAQGHISDAMDILQVAQDFLEHGDLDKMLKGVNEHDTLVREDVYENLRENEELFAVLKTLESCYYGKDEED